MFDNHTQQSRDAPFDMLLAEDNPGDVHCFEEAMQTTESQTNLHIVTDGDEAVQFLTQRGEYESTVLPDLILLDLNLPYRDGCEVLEVIGDDPQLRRIPVIIITSSDAHEDITRCYDADANAYVTKPTDFDEFVALVESIDRFWLQTVQHPPVPK